MKKKLYNSNAPKCAVYPRIWRFRSTFPILFCCSIVCACVRAANWEQPSIWYRNFAHTSSVYISIDVKLNGYSDARSGIHGERSRKKSDWCAQHHQQQQQSNKWFSAKSERMSEISPAFSTTMRTQFSIHSASKQRSIHGSIYCICCGHCFIDADKHIKIGAKMTGQTTNGERWGGKGKAEFQLKQQKILLSALTL